MNFTNLATDVQYLVLSLTPATLSTCAVDKFFATNLRKRQGGARLRLQRWYRSNRLAGSYPPLRVTRKTQIRYIITKYKDEWLERYPRLAVAKLVIGGAELFCTPAVGNLTSRFRAFCDAHMATQRMFEYVGW